MKSPFYWCSLVLVWASVACSSSPQETTLNNGPEKQPTPDMKVEENLEEADTKRIVFFGNSITAGYQLDPATAFPALLQKRLDSLEYTYEVVNAGLSGETTAAGVERLDWVLKGQVDIFALELGANDGLRGLPLSETKKNLLLMIDAVRKVNPDVKILLLGMEVPPNMGDDYAAEFREVFQSVAQEREVAFIPFLLQGVAGIKELNLQDGIHPTEEGHRMLAETIWEKLEGML